MNAMSALKWELPWKPQRWRPWAFYLALIQFFVKHNLLHVLCDLHKARAFFDVHRFGHGGLVRFESSERRPLKAAEKAVG